MKEFIIKDLLWAFGITALYALSANPELSTALIVSIILLSLLFINTKLHIFKSVGTGRIITVTRIILLQIAIGWLIIYVYSSFYPPISLLAILLVLAGYYYLLKKSKNRLSKSK